MSVSNEIAMITRTIVPGLFTGNFFTTSGMVKLEAFDSNVITSDSKYIESHFVIPFTKVQDTSSCLQKLMFRVLPSQKKESNRNYPQLLAYLSNGKHFASLAFTLNFLHVALCRFTFTIIDYGVHCDEN